MLCLNVVLWLQYYVQYVGLGLFMFLIRCHEFPFPATRGHLPRGATFAPNRRWPLVAGTTVIQKRAIRIIHNINYRHHTDPIFKANTFFKNTDLYKYHVLSFMYDCTHHFLPESFEIYIVVDTENKWAPIP